MNSVLRSKVFCAVLEKRRRCDGGVCGCGACGSCNLLHSSHSTAGGRWVSRRSRICEQNNSAVSGKGKRLRRILASLCPQPTYKPAAKALGSQLLWLISGPELPALSSVGFSFSKPCFQFAVEEASWDHWHPEPQTAVPALCESKPR